MTDIGLLWNAGLLEPIDGMFNIAICDKEHAYLVVSQLDELGVKPLAYTHLVLHEALRIGG
jgi:asparagine synthetase B (glutamine-hydrolysing)